MQHKNIEIIRRRATVYLLLASVFFWASFLSLEGKARFYVTEVDETYGPPLKNFLLFLNERENHLLEVDGYTKILALDTIRPSEPFKLEIEVVVRSAVVNESNTIDPVNIEDIHALDVTWEILRQPLLYAKLEIVGVEEVSSNKIGPLVEDKPGSLNAVWFLLPKRGINELIGKITILDTQDPATAEIYGLPSVSFSEIDPNFDQLSLVLDVPGDTEFRIQINESLLSRSMRWLTSFLGSALTLTGIIKLYTLLSDRRRAVRLAKGEEGKRKSRLIMPGDQQ